MGGWSPHSAIVLRINIVLGQANPGQLVPRAEFYLGSRVNKFLRFRTRCPPRQPVEEHLRFAAVFGTLDGALGQLVPVGEQDFNRLSRLFNAMSFALSHPAGLNPRAFRAYKPRFETLRGPVGCPLSPRRTCKVQGFSTVL